MVSMVRFVFVFVFFLLLSWSWSQDDSTQVLSNRPICASPFFSQSLYAEMEFHGPNADMVPQSFQIQWKHHVESQTDTFIIIQSKRQWIYISHPQIRILKDLHYGSSRAMAMHHLREPILGTILRYDDLELLAKGLLLCADSTMTQRIHKDQDLIPAKSETWYRLKLSFGTPPPSITFLGYRKNMRMAQLNTWDSLPGILRSFPAEILFESNSRSLRMRVRSIEARKTSKVRSFLNESWSPHLD